MPALISPAPTPSRGGTGWPPDRASGVLLPVAALPGGRLGPEARALIDWLERAGQRFWQILPLGPPDRFGSPYASPSAFAGSPLLLGDPEARVSPSEARAFRRQHAYWVDDWLGWCGETGALDDQVRFDREWKDIRRYARAHGVRIVDLPIYVARESADVAAHPDLFDLDRAAGVPPDLFTTTGQLWGNPTYRWGALRRSGYRWWIERFRRTMDLVDATRIDHFRGFVAFWAVPRGSRTAEHGRWYRSPGIELFRAVAAELGPLPLVAEDLGVITGPVHRLREELGALGMHVLEFGFGSLRDSHHPRNHRELSVVYTGTHDHAPAAGWWRTTTPGQRRRVHDALVAAGIEEADPVWSFVELALSSRAVLSVVQLQDVLGLGDEARTNVPGSLAGNWSWRLEPDALDAGTAERLRELTARHGRCEPAARHRRRRPARSVEAPS
jgi:4-alpha-glucanotransferase